MAEINSTTTLTGQALKLLRSNPGYLADARQYSLVDNSIAGSVLSLTLGVERIDAEHAVRAAVAAVDQEQRS